MKKILFVFGTRPEAIKMSPLIIALKEHSDIFKTSVCITAQHREMLDQVLEIFEITPDYDLNIMEAGQDLFDVTVKAITGLREVLKIVKPDLVLVHGDTTTSFAAALSSFYHRIPVAHIEAGLRTYNIHSPWPEEMNRQLTSRITSLHFAPTLSSQNNLINEGINHNRIFTTGNTVIDALKIVLSKINNDENLKENIIKNIYAHGFNMNRINKMRKVVLITGHRRENFGTGFINICIALRELSCKFPDCDFVYPMHLNPNVRKPIDEIFPQKGLIPNLFFIEPLEYLSFVYLMSKSTIILTDSGGIQEEAPSLGKPVLVMRDTTERPEAVEAGTVKLVGTDSEKIILEVSRLLTDKNFYNQMSQATNPYGDGYASTKIVRQLIKLLKNENWINSCE